MESREQDNDEFLLFGQKNTQKVQSILPTNIAQSIIITPDEYKFVLEEIKLIPNFVDSNIKRSIMVSTNQFIKSSYIPKCKEEDFTQIVREYDKCFASLYSQLSNVSVTNPECDNIETFDSIGALSDINTVDKHSSIKYPNLIAKLKELKYLCYKWRKVKGDGNCFYRSIIFSYIENIILTNNIQDLMSLIYNMSIKFKDPYFQSILQTHNIESNNIMMCMILVYLAIITPSKNKDPIMISYEIFFKCFNNINHFDYGLVLYIRFLYYSYIKNNEEMLYTKDFCVLLGNLLPAEYETDEGKFLFKEFYKDFLMKLYKDAEKIIIYLTPYILDINLNILMFEEHTESLQGLKFIHENQSGTYQNIVTILYRKSHFDLAYNDLFVKKFYQYLSIFKMENDNISIYNKSEIQRKMSNGFNLLNQSFYSQKSQNKQSQLYLTKPYNNQELKQGIIIDPSIQSMHNQEEYPLAESIAYVPDKENELKMKQSIVSNDKDDNEDNEDNDIVEPDQDNNDDEFDGNMVNDVRFTENQLKESKTMIKKSFTELNVNPMTKPLNTKRSDNNNDVLKQTPNTTPLKQLSTPKTLGMGRPLLTLKSNVPRDNTVMQNIKAKAKVKDNTINQPLNTSPSFKSNVNTETIISVKQNQIIIPNKKKANHNKAIIKQPLLFKSALPPVKEQDESIIHQLNKINKTENFNVEEIKTIVETKEKMERPQIRFPKLVQEIPNKDIEQGSPALSQRTASTDSTSIQNSLFSLNSQRDVKCKTCKKEYYNQFSENRFNLCNDCLYNELIEKLTMEYKSFIKDSLSYSLTFSEYINQKSIIINKMLTFPEEIINRLNMMKYYKNTSTEAIINSIEKKTCVICFYRNNTILELSLPCKCRVCSSLCLLKFIEVMKQKDNCEYVCFCNQIYDKNTINTIVKLLEDNNLHSHIEEFKKRIILHANCMMGCGKSQLNNNTSQWEKITVQYTNEDKKTIQHFICIECKNKSMIDPKCSICKKVHIQIAKKESLIPDTKDCIIF